MMKPHAANWGKLEEISPDGRPIFRCNRCARQSTTPDQPGWTMEMLWPEAVIPVAVLRPAGWLIRTSSQRRIDLVPVVQWAQGFLF